jgi:hypothetical protein
MRVARFSGATSAARRFTASRSAASASRPRARTSSRERVPSWAGSSKRMTCSRWGAFARTSSTFFTCAALEAMATLAWLSLRT